jgi:hypothetical protein
LQYIYIWLRLTRVHMIIPQLVIKIPWVLWYWGSPYYSMCKHMVVPQHEPWRVLLNNVLFCTSWDILCTGMDVSHCGNCSDGLNVTFLQSCNHIKSRLIISMNLNDIYVLPHFLLHYIKTLLAWIYLPFATLLTGKWSFTCMMLHMLLHIHFLCKCLATYITHESSTQFVYILMCCKTSSCMKTEKIIKCGPIDFKTSMLSLSYTDY